MDFLQAVIYGVVEGFTEFLPVSSTGHLILLSKILGNSQTDFIKSFEIAIQSGAILAVAVLYFRKVIFDLNIIKKVIVAFIPTGVIGFVAYKLIKNLFNEETVIWSLFLGGVVIIIFEYFRREKVRTSYSADISYPQAILIGAFQSFSVIPGVSRAAATILGGMALGIEREKIVEFSFLLAVPTMVAATGYDILKNPDIFSVGNFHVLAVGLIVSFAAAMVSIKFLLGFIRRNSFTAFGFYRIIVSGIFWFVIL